MKKDSSKPNRISDLPGTAAHRPQLSGNKNKPTGFRNRGFLTYIPVIVTLCGGLILSITVLSVTRHLEEKRMELQLAEIARNQISMVKLETKLHLMELASIAAFFVGSVEVERDEFNDFVSVFLRAHKNAHALVWAPRVTESQRAHYAKAARRDGLADFQITEMTAAGEKVPAAGRSEYFPVYYIEPFGPNKQLFGFDLSSNPVLFEAMSQSRTTGRQAATPRLKLTDRQNDDCVILIFQPVYHKHTATDAQEAGHKTLQGFVVEFFNVQKVLKTALAHLTAAGIDLFIYDNSASGKKRFLYGHISNFTKEPVSPGASEADLTKGIYYSDTLDVAGRQWLIICRPTARYIEAHKSSQPWWNFSVGLLLTGILGSYFASTVRRAERIEQLVHQRTVELEKEVAEHERADLALRTSEKKFRDLAEITTDFVWEVDKDGVYTYASPKIRDLLGYEPQEVIGGLPFDLMPDEEAKKISKIFKAKVANSEPFYQLENINRHKDGRLVVLETSGVPLFDEKGQLIGYRGIDRDVTKRKHAEEQLAKERNLLRTLIDNIPDYIYVKDAGSRFLIGNAAVARVMKTNPEDLVGKIDFDFFPPEVAAEFYSDEQRIIQTGQSMINKDEPVTDSNGRTRWVLTTKVPLRDSDGKIIGIAGTGHDITDRKLVEMARDRLNSELEAKNKELESILNVASHDLRSSLVNIQGFSNELARSCEHLFSALGDRQIEKRANLALKQGIPEALDFILTSAHKMDSLLSGLLRISRLGRAVINVEPLDINKMMVNISGDMEFQVKQTGAVLNIKPLPPCRGDASQINQVFTNLLDNALKYLDKARPGRINIYGRTENGKSVYYIEDNGIGIAENHKEKIFEIFHQLDPEDKSGEGLGLTIVRRILDRHDGAITVESQPGKGSKFSVSLPST